ncbi:MAG: hypothetical protein Q9217_006041 [Psora testacea]
MSFQRYTRSLTSSSYRLSRISSLLSDDAATARKPSPLFCSRCYAQRHQRGRSFATATEYKPYTLDPAPPPPRNTNIPNTSIAGPKPEVNDTRPPHMIGQHDAISVKRQEQASIRVTETEAQKSKPVTGTTKPTNSPEKTTKRPKLRPRKAAMSLTPNAITQLRNLLDQPEPKLIRVGVKNRGCSGLAYHLEYVDKPGMFDEAVEQGGVKVLVDSKALFSIIGSEMDWVEDKLEQRFVFRNPNIRAVRLRRKLYGIEGIAYKSVNDIERFSGIEWVLHLLMRRDNGLASLQQVFNPHHPTPKLPPPRTF